MTTTRIDSPARVDEEENKRLRDAIEKRTGKSPEQLRAEREKRIADAIELREPDRVPVTIAGGYFAARYCGLTASVAYYDPVTYRQGLQKNPPYLQPGSAPGGGGRGGR